MHKRFAAAFSFLHTNNNSQPAIGTSSYFYLKSKMYENVGATQLAKTYKDAGDFLKKEGC